MASHNSPLIDSLPNDLPEDPQKSYAVSREAGALEWWSISDSLAPESSQKAVAPNDTDSSVPAWLTVSPRDSDGATLSDPREPNASVSRETISKEGSSEASEPQTLNNLAALPEKNSELRGRPVPSEPFQLLQRVGQGGMGEVWAARQVALDRLVAVKKIRSDYLQRADASGQEQTRAEFRLEALTAARLEHPNIVPAHDLGFDQDGSPLLAMKLAQGCPWNDLIKADFPALAPADFLAKHLPILISVAQAVAFAHSKGIIHRDLKPAQAMVGDYGETLLMDWGLAIRRDDDPPTDGANRSELAERSGQLAPLPLPTPQTASNPAGTPAYMAPEQTASTADNIGPWTDIYLLGSILCELLCGAPPHRARTGREAMMRAMSGEIEPLSERAPGREIPPDLERLCLQALERDPAQRPASVKDFIRALQDSISGASKRRESDALAREASEALDALEQEKALLPAQALYARHNAAADLAERSLRLWPENLDARRLRARQLASRLETEIGHGDLVLAQFHLDELGKVPETAPQLFEALAGQLGQALARRERLRRQRFALAAAAGVFLLCALVLALVAWRKAGEARQNATLAETRAREAERDRSTAMENLKGTASLVDYLLGELREQLNLENEKDQKIAKALGQSVFDYYRNADASGLSRELLLERAEQLFNVGKRFDELELIKEAEPMFLEALAIYQPQIGSNNTTTALTLYSLGGVYTQLGRHRDSIAVSERALEIYNEILGSDTIESAHVMNNLAIAHIKLHETSRGLELLRRSAAIQKKAQPHYDPNHAATLNNLAQALKEYHQFDQALQLAKQSQEIIEKTVAPDNPSIAKNLRGLAEVLHAMGRFREEEPLRARIYKIFLNSYGSDNFNTIESLVTWGKCLLAQKRSLEALEMMERALASRERLLNPNSNEIILTKYNLAEILAELLKIDKSIDLMENVLKIVRQNNEQHKPIVLIYTKYYTDLLMKAHRYQEALKISQSIVETAEKGLGLNDEQTILAWEHLATQLVELKRYKEALPLFERALAQRKSLDLWDEAAMRALQNFACSKFELGNVDEGISLLRQASTWFEKNLGPAHFYTTESWINLAHILARTNQRKVAIQLLSRALEERKRWHGIENPNTIESAMHLVMNLYEVLDWPSIEEPARIALQGRELLIAKEPESSDALFNACAPRYYLAWSLFEQRRVAEAMPLLQQNENVLAELARRSSFQEQPTWHEMLANNLLSQGHALNALGRPAEGLAYQRRALAIRQELYPFGHPEIAQSRRKLVECLVNVARQQDAEGQAEGACASRAEAGATLAELLPLSDPRLVNLAIKLLEDGWRDPAFLNACAAAGIEIPNATVAEDSSEEEPSETAPQAEPALAP
jgi:serine/threonine protein kinase